MKRSLTILTAAALALACNKVEPEGDVIYGELGVSLGEPEVELITKAKETLSQSDVSASAYTVAIFTKAGESKYSETYKDFKSQVLPLGTYYVTAQNCSETEAENGDGQMRLFGQSADITLSTSNLSQTATVDCTVQNAKFTVAFDSSVNGNFDNLTVTLTRDAAPARNFTVAQPTSERVFWFNPSTVSYSIDGQLNAGGVVKQVSKTGTVTLEKKSNVTLLVKLNLDNGQLLVPTVTFDDSLGTEQKVEHEFNPYE